MSASPESTGWRDVARRRMDCHSNIPLMTITNRTPPLDTDGELVCEAAIPGFPDLTLLTNR